MLCTSLVGRRAGPSSPCRRYWPAMSSKCQIEQLLLLIRASDALALVGLDLQVASAADVPEVSRNRAPSRSSAGHFHHDLRGTAHGARDLGNLREAESSGHLRTAAPVLTPRRVRSSRGTRKLV